VETAKATYLIAATDPCWLAHLAPGMEWYSTAYDHDEKVVFDTAWRTSTVLALAKHVDESGDFSVMPILADALQDAGCADEQLLGHCRGSGPHARGCWAVDLLLRGRFDPRTLDAADVSQVDVEFWPVDAEEGAERLPGPSSSSRERIGAIIAAVRSAQEIDDKGEWARGVIRFARRGEGATELMFYPGRDAARYELRTAGRAYCVGREVFVTALRRIGADLPLE
jgi:hypothetical protein